MISKEETRIRKRIKKLILFFKVVAGLQPLPFSIDNII